MAEIPKSIDVWICETCRQQWRVKLAAGHRSPTDFPGVFSTCPGEPACHVYVLAEPTDEMIEAAARAMYAEDADAWDRLPENWRGLHRTRARAALEAALSTQQNGGNA